MSDVQLRFYRDRIEARANEAALRSAKEIAMQIMAQAMVNIVDNDQVDTGALLNSGYVLSTVTYDMYGQAASAAAARNPSAQVAPKAPLEDADALVAFSMEYALWQELRLSYLEKAARSVSNDQKLKISIEKIAKEVIHD